MVDLIPPAIRNFRAALMTPSSVMPNMTAEYVYEFHSDDRTYTSTQYNTNGTWTGTTTPWLNDLSSIPAEWQWTHQDTADQEARGKELETQLAAMKPATSYSGTTAQQIELRYAGDTSGGSPSMWSTDVFPQAELDSLFIWIDDDKEFARQRLGGANPNVIASGAKFDIAGWIGGASNAGDLSALQTAMATAQAAGNLYICDYRPVLGSVITKDLVQKNRYLTAPVAIFEVTNGALMPMAIQIDGTQASSYIFAPGDDHDPNGDAWLLAKLWTATADMTWWFSGSHLFNTHSIDMVFGIAAVNQMKAVDPLLPDHPMLVLAEPHLVKSFNINTAVYNNAYEASTKSGGSSGIYQTDSFCDQVLATGRIGIYEIINNLYSNFDFEAAAFDKDMAARGLTSGGIANISFPFRDDGKIWFDALAAFVSGIVDATYADDAAVAADGPLNGWMAQVQTAFNTNPGSAPRYTWTPTKAALSAAFTNLIFVCSVQHTSVNNSMLNGWAFTPNGPFAMQAAPPADAASVTQAIVLSSLPDPTQPGVDGTTVGQPATDMQLIRNQVSFVMNGTAGVSEILADPDLHSVYTYPDGTGQYDAVTAFASAMLDGASSVDERIAANQKQRIAAYGGSPVPNSVSYFYFSTTEIAAEMFLNAPATRAIQI